MPRVSVIIPTYNQASYLPEAIRSVLGQTFQDFEIIVVNDGSTDNTSQEMVNFSDPRIRYFSQENRGPSAARNTGILASVGEYIAFLDSDDVWLPRKLELQVELLDSKPEAALVYSDACLFDDRTGAVTGKFLDGKRVFSGKVLKHLLSVQFIKTSTVVVRRGVFETVGRFDESMREVQDREMWLRIAHQFNIEGTDIPLVMVRAHETNVSRNWEKVWVGRALVLSKAARTLALGPDELDILKKNLAIVYFQHGRYLVLEGRPREGREKLMAGARLSPGRLGIYPYLAVSLVSRRLIVRARLLIRWVRSLSRATFGRIRGILPA
jgi:glycosyltransferase involved in cell wall biosynthesis